MGAGEENSSVMHTRLQHWLDQARERLMQVGPWLALLAFAAAGTIHFLPDRKAHVYFVALAIAFAIIVGREVGRVIGDSRAMLCASAGYIALAMLVPVFVVLADIHFAVGRVDRRVTVPYPPVPIIIKNSPLGGLFNASYDHQIGLQLANKVSPSEFTKPKPGYTHVFTVGDEGADWVLHGNEASFSYDRHDHGFQADWSTSGGLVSFPDVPIDRLVYQYVTFDCRVTDALGVPDLGLRLVVDDPSIASAYKEIAVYELGSLNRQFVAKLSEFWQKYEVYALGLTESPKAAQLSHAHDKDTNKINKVVFFITDAMLNRSARGTVWIRNVVFSTSRQFTQ